MKFILILFIFVTAVQNTYPHSIKNREIHIFNTLWNKTSAVTNYVKAKGRSLKNFYHENVSKRIKSYFGYDNTTIHEYVEQNLDSVKDKFRNYIDKAQKTASTIYDNIAASKIEYHCSDTNVTNDMTTAQVIAYYGYTSETHIVRTEDGFLLAVHRIPYFKHVIKDSPQKTVLLHHGFLGSSIDWVMQGPEKGLAFILSDAGYDVWMTNVRGNTYSRAHVTLDVNSYAFWNFTFHDVGQYDLPAVIDYILHNKGSSVKINYIGFSMGTTVLFSMLSTKPLYNNVLRAGFALAPIVYMTNISSPMRLISQFGNNIEIFMNLVGANEFLPRNAVIRYLSKHACKITDFQEAICEMTMFVLCGYSKMHFDRSLMPIILHHLPAGASTKTLAHYLQEINDGGQFQQFNYGPEKNMKLYGTQTPPAYPINKITLPIALLNSDNDWLSSVPDVKRLYDQLQNPIELYTVKDFNHLDFLFARDARSLVYDKLLVILEKDPYEDCTDENRL